MYIGAEENANSQVNFQPTILKGIGYTSNAAQVHSIPVYIVALVFSLFFAWLSERVRHRFAFALLGYATVLVGLSVILALPKRTNLRYMGLFFITSGAYLVMPLTVVWIAINVGKGYKRAVAIGAIIGFGNCGAFVASNVFITEEAPKYHTGFSTGLVFCCVGAAASTVYFLGCYFGNKRRDKRRAELPAVLDEGSVEDLGEKHPDFRYQL
jgi:MFS family permease